MRLRVACEHSGCDKWADLEWDDGGWWGGFEVDEDNERAELGLDKSFKLPVGWDVRYHGIQSDERNQTSEPTAAPVDGSGEAADAAANQPGIGSRPPSDDVRGPLIGGYGKQWGVRVLLPSYTRREPVALVYVHGPRWYIGLRLWPWVRKARRR